MLHLINDPIHGVMRFTTTEKNAIKPILDHPLFQRLRHIKQLGVTSLVFPGAVHTRFNHSLGCCFVAKRMLDAIEEDNQVLRLTIIKAALLHDIGHGPFSHAFEKFLDDKCKHEQWSELFIQDILSDEPEIDTIVSLINGKKNESIEVSNNGILNTILEAMKRKDNETKSTNDLIYDVVSSQLDADRIDYLM